VTGEYALLADRWQVDFCDLSGNQGMIGQVVGQVEGHTCQRHRLLARPGPARLARSRRGRRRRHGHDLPVRRAAESLTLEQFAKILGALDRDPHGRQIAIAWIAKEKLRDALRLRARLTRSQPCERQVRDKLFTFYDWCAAHEDIPELRTLAKTVSRWEEQIVTALLTGLTNAAAESLNRIAKLEGRLDGHHPPQPRPPNEQ
jgi:hypothetical protein